MNTKIPSRPILYIRSILFWLGFILSTIVVGLLIIFLFFTPSDFRLTVAKLWCGSTLWWLKITCKLDYIVEGSENIGKQNAVVLCKHQSTWETIALHAIVPLGRWVFKRELMKIPIFGWALALTDPIAIDRASGRKAVVQLIREGTEKLKQGKWMILFPEGTRATPGGESKYKIGGALLATKSGYPILPIAHNAGEFWPKHSFIKWPGTITVRVGLMIETTDKKADEVLAQTEQWIEGAMQEISDSSRWNRK